MAKIGIIAALDCEIELFIKEFNAVPVDANKYIYKGSFSGHNAYLTLCGVGKVNAAVCAQRLFDFASPDFVINSGVAGGISEKLEICDVAISSELTYHDFYPIDVLDKYSPHCSVFRADDKLVKLAVDAAIKLSTNEEKFNYEVGMIVSGDRFVEDNAYKKELREKYNALCTEMEGAAVAHAAVVNKIPFLVIRAISDKADENANVSFETIANIAAHRASLIVKEIISNY